MFRVDYGGVSEARQLDIRKGEERARAWKFEAVIDPAHHPDLIQVRSGEILSDYFHLHILQRISNWEEMKEAWGLVSYSVQRNHDIFSEHVPVVGYFRHGSENPRLREVQGMFNGMPGLTVN